MAYNLSKRKKILFITSNGVIDATYGGVKGCIRNYTSLKKYNDVDVYHIQKKTELYSAISCIQFRFPPIRMAHEQEILKRIKEKKYEIVFLDGSIFGSIAKKIKQYNKKIKIIVFFNNCEFDYIKVRFLNKNGIKKIIYQYLVRLHESYCIQYSNIRIALSIRDKLRIEALYHTKVQEIIPLSIEDMVSINKNSIPISKEKICLLFGPAGVANYIGFKWFVQKVSPYIQAKTVIAGKGFEQYKRELESNKVTVLGYIENIEQLYGMANCIAIPLLNGAGMKVKTAEALMFGKYIFGTKEAFEGYELNYKKVGGCCNTAQEFIHGINRILLYQEKEKEIFNDYCRKIYLEKYSLEATQHLFDKIIDR